MLSRFDPFLAEHITRYGNKRRGNASYLSSRVCDELICLMGNKVSQRIIEEVHKAKYFSFTVDSTLDISHVDQLSFTIRYVSEEGKPLERFLKFVPISGHGAEDLAGYVIKTFQEIEINLNNCSGRSFDSAANMSGKYSGLQGRIKSVSRVYSVRWLFSKSRWCSKCEVLPRSCKVL